MCAKLVNLGSLCIDEVYSVPNIAREGETVSSLGRHQFPGGKGLNQSISASLAGTKVLHHGAVGSDGDILLTALKAAGVDVSGVALSQVDSGRAFIQVDSRGRNAIVIDGGANRSISTEQRQLALEQMEPSDWLLLQNEINDLDKVIRAGEEHGLKMALNLAPVDARITDYPLELLDMLIVNQLEGRAVADSQDSGLVLAEQIANLFPTTSIMLTEGKNGSILIDRENRLVVETGIFVMDVVDETAAGDAFVGYFLSGLVENKAIDLVVKEASAAGALAVSKSGAATSIPKRSEVEKLLGEQPITQGMRAQ